MANFQSIRDALTAWSKTLSNSNFTSLETLKQTTISKPDLLVWLRCHHHTDIADALDCKFKDLASDAERLDMYIQSAIQAAKLNLDTNPSDPHDKCVEDTRRGNRKWHIEKTIPEQIEKVKTSNQTIIDDIDRIIQMLPPSNPAVLDDAKWPRQGRAAIMLGCTTGTITRLAKGGKLKTNGKSGQERKFNPESILALQGPMKRRREKREDAADQRRH